MNSVPLEHKQPALATRAVFEGRRKHRSELKLAMLALLKDKLALAGTAIVVLSALVALAAPILSPYDPNASPPTASRLLPPLSDGFLLGTDGQGRDILSRMIWGGRITIPIALAPILVSSLLGLALGVCAGYFRGLAGAFIMRSLDVIFAFPGVLLAVAVAAIMGPGMMNVMLAMSIVILPYVARIVYVETSAVAQMEFIAAARVSGLSASGILFREVLPNVIGSVIVFGTTSMGGMMVLAAGLSFLGVGVQPPTADWGIMASDGRVVLSEAPWVSIIPGIGIVIVAVAWNVMGDGLRDVMDPRQRTRR